MDQSHSLAILRGLSDAARPTKANGESNKIVLTTPIHHPVWEVMWFSVKPVQHNKRQPLRHKASLTIKWRHSLDSRADIRALYFLFFQFFHWAWECSITLFWIQHEAPWTKHSAEARAEKPLLKSPVTKRLLPPASAFTPPFRWLTWTWNHLGATPDTHCWKGIKCCFSSSSTFPCMISVMSITRREIKVIRDTNGSMPHRAVQKRMVSQTQSTRRKEPGTKP